MASTPAGAATPRQRSVSPALAGVVSLAAFAAVSLLPLLGVFVGLLASLPLLQLAASGRSSLLGWGWVTVALVGAALLLQAPWLSAVALGYLLVAAWPAVAVELWVRRAWSTGRWSAAVALLVWGAVSVAMVAAFHPQPPAEGLRAMLAPSIVEGGEVARAMGALGASVDVLGAALDLTAYVAPAIVACYVLTAALWVRPRLPLLGLPRGEEPFAAYRSEEWLPVAFALGGLGWVFAGGVAKWLATNLFLVVLCLYFVHGLAIIHFHLGRRFGSNRWVRLAVALFALQMPVAVALAALGLVDNFFSLRRGGSSDGGSEA